MPLLDPDTGHPMTVDATEDESTTVFQEDEDEATIETLEVEAPKELEPRQQRKKGLLGRFRRRRKEKQPVADKRDQTPSPTPAADARDKSSTPSTDDDDDDDEEEGEWVNNKNQQPSVGASSSSRGPVVLEEKQSLKQVRFPANQATKTVPIYQRKIVPKAPSAREAAFGGPPRYDWIDIVRRCHGALFHVLENCFVSRPTDVTRFVLTEGYFGKYFKTRRSPSSYCHCALG